MRLCLLAFDEGYRRQSFYQDHDFEWIDLRDILETRLMCTPNAQIEIQKRLQNRKHKGRTFIGSNHYHYVTFLLLREINEPFTLILFDHHIDAFPPPCPGFLSCGSWVKDSIFRLPLLRRVLVLGGEQTICSQAMAFVGQRLFIQDGPLILQNDEQKRHFISLFAGSPVYLSIDKDVLDPSEASTDWDQGNMTLAQLTELILLIAQSASIIGWDVCGEATDSIYEPQKYADEKNDKANQAILQAFSQIEQDFSGRAR